MNAYQPRTKPRHGYDSSYSSFQSAGMSIFGYDASANWVTTFNLEASRGAGANFRQFTGKERDSESGLDYFGARYYGSALGRWTSPDWSARPQPVPYAELSNPQSLNLYSYVQNNPLKNRDADGHWCLFGIGTTCNAPLPKPPAPPSAPPVGPDGAPLAGPTAAATIRVGNTRAYRAAWSKANPGMKWPKDATGQNLQADHETAIADGGDPLDGNNITPRTKADHIKRHQENGDFKRWGARSQQGTASEGEDVQLPRIPPPIPPELAPDPPVMIPGRIGPIEEIPEIPIEPPIIIPPGAGT